MSAGDRCERRSRHPPSLHGEVDGPARLEQVPDGSAPSPRLVFDPTAGGTSPAADATGTAVPTMG
jgi:hypothetical protein